MKDSILPSPALRAHISGLLKLSRWKEHLPFTVPATLLGVNMAAHYRPALVTPDWRVPIVVLANVLAVTFAFMVNDVEDAPDDARDPQRGARNAVTCAEISPRDGWRASVVVGGLALVLFACAGWATCVIGALTLGLGFLYSWRRVRLKAVLVIDVFVHLLMLSVLLFLAGYFAWKRKAGDS